MRGIRVGAVANDADRRTGAGAPVPVVAGIEQDDRLGPALFQPRLGLRGRIQKTPEREVVVILQFRDNVPDRGIAWVADDVDSGVADFRADRKTEKKNLHHRHFQDNEHRSGIPENVQELFMNE